MCALAHGDTLFEWQFLFTKLKKAKRLLQKIKRPILCNSCRREGKLFRQTISLAWKLFSNGAGKLSRVPHIRFYQSCPFIQNEGSRFSTFLRRKLQRERERNRFQPPWIHCSSRGWIINQGFVSFLSQRKFNFSGEGKKRKKRAVATFFSLAPGIHRKGRTKLHNPLLLAKPFWNFLKWSWRTILCSRSFCRGFTDFWETKNEDDMSKSLICVKAQREGMPKTLGETSWVTHGKTRMEFSCEIHSRSTNIRYFPQSSINIG